MSMIGPSWGIQPGAWECIQNVYISGVPKTDRLTFLTANIALVAHFPAIEAHFEDFKAVNTLTTKAENLTTDSSRYSKNFSFYPFIFILHS